MLEFAAAKVPEEQCSGNLGIEKAGNHFAGCASWSLKAAGTETQGLKLARLSCPGDESQGTAASSRPDGFQDSARSLLLLFGAPIVPETHSNPLTPSTSSKE